MLLTSSSTLASTLCSSSWSWSPLVLVSASVYAVLVVATLIDIVRHPRELLLLQQRWPWVLISLALVPAGFALYFLFGRLTPEDVLPPDAR